jgi:hypothetical protein
MIETKTFHRDGLTDDYPPAQQRAALAYAQETVDERI